MGAVWIAIYMAVMLGIGWWGKSKTKSLNDFFLGGRSIGPWMSAFAYGTTYFSAVIFIGFAGKLGWGYGLAAVWIGIGNALIGSFLSWLVLGARTRRMTHNLGAMTMPEFFEARYGSALLKRFAAVLVFVFLLPYSASVYKGLSHLFEVGFHLDYQTALIWMTVVTGAYLVLGGYFAVTLTDFVQGLIMLVGCLAMLAVLVGKAGGLGQAIPNLIAAHAQHVPADKAPPGLILAATVFMTSFGVWGLPQMTQKFYAIKDEKLIPRAAVATLIFATVIGCTAYFNGALTHVFRAAPPLTNGKPDWDMLVPDVLVANLPAGLLTLIMLLVLAASMSTLASLVLVAASAVTIDLAGKSRDDRTGGLLMIRILSGVFVLCSYLIAVKKIAFIVALMSLSWGVLAGAFLAPYVYGLFWKRTSQAAVWVGMISGVAITVGLFIAWGPDKSPLAASLAMIIPLGLVPLVSLFTPPPPEAMVERAFAAAPAEAA